MMGAHTKNKTPKGQLEMVTLCVSGPERRNEIEGPIAHKWRKMKIDIELLRFEIGTCRGPGRAKMADILLSPCTLHNVIVTSALLFIPFTRQWPTSYT